MDELGFGDHGRPADTAAFSGGHRAGVGGTLQGVGAFHLGEQRQQHHSELCHRIIRVAGIDADRIGKVTHADAAFAGAAGLAGVAGRGVGAGASGAPSLRLGYLPITDSAPLLLAHGGAYLNAFSEPQRAALAMVFLRLHHYDLMTSFVFAGLWLFPFGILVYKSGFLPKTLGVWLIINGFPYIAYTFVDFLAPQYYDTLTTVTQPILFGEIAIMLWLLIMGARPSFRPLKATRS